MRPLPPQRKACSKVCLQILPRLECGTTASTRLSSLAHFAQSKQVCKRALHLQCDSRTINTHGSKLPFNVFSFVSTISIGNWQPLTASPMHTKQHILLLLADTLQQPNANIVSLHFCLECHAVCVLSQKRCDFQLAIDHLRFYVKLE